MKIVFNNLLIIILLIISGCDPSDNRLRIHNSTKDTIYYLLVDEKIPGMEQINIKPYYIEKEKNDTIWYNPTNMIMPDSFRIIPSMDKWEDEFNNDLDKTLHLFIYPKDTLLKHDWTTIKENNLYSKKYDFTMEDILKWNWVIKYP